MAWMGRCWQPSYGSCTPATAGECVLEQECWAGWSGALLPSTTFCMRRKGLLVRTTSCGECSAQHRCSCGVKPAAAVCQPCVTLLLRLSPAASPLRSWWACVPWRTNMMSHSCSSCAWTPSACTSPTTGQHCTGSALCDWAAATMGLRVSWYAGLSTCQSLKCGRCKSSRHSVLTLNFTPACCMLCSCVLFRCCCLFYKAAKEIQQQEIQQLAWEQLSSNLHSLVQQHDVFVQLEFEDVLRLFSRQDVLADRKSVV